MCYKFFFKKNQQILHWSFHIIVLPFNMTGFALYILSKFSGTETGSPEATIGEDAGPTKVA